MTTDLTHTVLVFFQRLLDDPNHRYRSWDHCHSCFQDRPSIEDDAAVDRAALHLAFFLASWGIYRGSSFLLQKDYKVHVPAVRELLQSRYESLWDIDPLHLDAHSPELPLLFELASRLRGIYREAGSLVDGKRRVAAPSDTLLTKVLLATLSCTPAYDRYFLAGVKAVGGIPARFGRRSYLALTAFYRDNCASFKLAQDRIAERGMFYPPMKLLDMYFWNLGYVRTSGPHAI